MISYRTSFNYNVTIINDTLAAINKSKFTNVTALYVPWLSQKVRRTLTLSYNIVPLLIIMALVKTSSDKSIKATSRKFINSTRHITKQKHLRKQNKNTQLGL